MGPGIIAAIVLGILGLIIVLILVIVRLVHVNAAKVYASPSTVEGKTIIITGATSGIGKAAVLDLAARGGRIIMGVRNLAKAKVVVDEIIESTGNRNIIFHYLDTSKFSSVRSFSKTIIDTEERIDVLILNAGITGFQMYHQNDEGIEITMATNYFGHFILLNLLLELLIKSGPSRIICVSSRMCRGVFSVTAEKIIIKETDFAYSNPYGLSKLCLIMMTRYLGPILKNHNVTINSMCPGLVQTEIFEKGSACLTSGMMGFFSRFFSRNTQQGAATILYLAVDDKVKDVTGKFFVDYKVTDTASLTKNENTIKDIWEESERAVGLTDDELKLIRELKSQL